MNRGWLIVMPLLVGHVTDVHPATPPPIEPDPSWKSLGESLWFDPNQKILVIQARVVLREGPLEHLLCLKATKEHESILATDASPRRIHAGLLLTGAEPGHPARFVPKFEPPAGSPVAIDLLWNEGGETRREDARLWVVDSQLGTPLKPDWVFAGSELYTDPISKQVVYAAEEGDLITVANFANAILDVPIASSAHDADRVFIASKERIPPVGTRVFLLLYPRTRPAKSTADRPA